MQKEAGTVKFTHEKGYGFIQKDDGGEIYFHAHSCKHLWPKDGECLLKKGTRIFFTEGTSIKGTREAKEIELESVAA